MDPHKNVFGARKLQTHTQFLTLTGLRSALPGGSGGNAQSGGGAGGGPLTSVGILLLFASAFLFDSAFSRWRCGLTIDVGLEIKSRFSAPLDAVVVTENGRE